MDGTRYYTTPECFLFFMGRLLTTAKDPELQKMLMPVFKERVQERIGAEGDALALGMRILACAAAGVRNTVDRGALLSMQCVDGGWETGWVYKLVVAKVRIGSRGLATAIALAALPTPVAPVAQPVVGVLQFDEQVFGRQLKFNDSDHSEPAQIPQGAFGKQKRPILCRVFGSRFSPPRVTRSLLRFPTFPHSKAL